VSLAVWRDVAIVWLALLCFIGMAVPLAEAVFAVKGTGLVLDRTPELLGKVHSLSRRMRAEADSGSRQVVTRVTSIQRRTDHFADVVRRRGSRSANHSRAAGGKHGV
jgi:hypothetical protein